MTLFKSPLLLTVPPTLEKRLEALAALRTLQAQDEELVRQRRAAIVALRRDFDELRRDFEAIRLRLAFEVRTDVLRMLKYNPEQPRVPAGQSGAGQWAKEGESGASSYLTASPEDGAEATRDHGPQDTVTVNDPRIISDATPDNTWKPGAQYAGGVEENENRGRGPFLDGSPGQEARLEFAERQWEDVRNQVRAIDPYWRPRPGAYETIEGAIADLEAKTREAEAYISTQAKKGIGPGPFACESIPAPTSGQLSAAQRAENNENGDEYGCHTCGTKTPGTPRGNWVGDHQPPSGLNIFGNAQRIYPQCLACSQRQGGVVRDMLGRSR